MRKATATQRKAYLKAINEKRPVPTGFVWDGVTLYVDPNAEPADDEQARDEDEDDKDAKD